MDIITCVILIIIASALGFFIGKFFPFRNKDEITTRESFERRVKESHDTYEKIYLNNAWTCTQTGKTLILSAGKNKILINLDKLTLGKKVVTQIQNNGREWIFSIRSYEESN